MKSIPDLLLVIDAYKAATGTEMDTTVSSRVFSDGKKIAALRKGREISVGRYNLAVRWFVEHWPTSDFPEILVWLSRDRPACAQDLSTQTLIPHKKETAA